MSLREEERASPLDMQIIINAFNLLDFMSRMMMSPLACYE